VVTNIKNSKTIIFAPHDDGSGAFAVLYRLARALVTYADNQGSTLNLYFLNSSEAQGGQDQLNRLTEGMNLKHSVCFVPTDNLIRLPKNPEKASVAGEEIPEILTKWVRPLWYRWPCEPNGIYPNLPVMSHEEWTNSKVREWDESLKRKWKGVALGQGNVWDLTDDWWRKVDLGISMGVPQLHRLAWKNGFPSIEVGDWFFSVGLQGCMEKSGVAPEVIAGTKGILRMIRDDEFKAKEYWGTLFQTPRQAYREHLANSSIPFKEMNGLLWTGDTPPRDIPNWVLAKELRNALDSDISNLRHTRVNQIACIIPGSTGVWTGIINKLKQRHLQQGNHDVATIYINRSTGAVSLLEDDGRVLENAGRFLKTMTVEEKGLAVSRASDFGIARSAGGALSFITTQRPVAFIDEPGHWLGDIQREQCIQAGLCVGVSIDDFGADPEKIIQNLARQVEDPDSALAQTIRVIAKLTVGAELNLARYIFETYK
jgi:hypothetical protein